jgi:hypothetical protein
MPSDDSLPRLTPNQILALVVLMTEARVLTNNELRDLAGFALTGADNTKLEKQLGLVETDRSHKPFSHQLTPKGLRVVTALHTTQPPKQGGSASRSMFTVLANLHRSLDRMQISAEEFFKQATATPAAPAGTPSKLEETQALIRAAYHDLARKPGTWVGLADLRDRLGDIDKKAVDQALEAMIHQRDVRIIPVANTKALKPRDHAAALNIAGEDNHTILIGQS